MQEIDRERVSVLPDEMVSPFALPLGPPSGLEQFSQHGVAPRVPPHGFQCYAQLSRGHEYLEPRHRTPSRPREFAEVGQVALRAGCNDHVASHVSGRLDMEGLGSLQSLRA